MLVFGATLLGSRPPPLRAGAGCDMGLYNYTYDFKGYRNGTLVRMDIVYLWSRDLDFEDYNGILVQMDIVYLWSRNLHVL